MTITRRTKIVHAGMATLPERWGRRTLRHAVHSRDADKLCELVGRGLNVNMVISDVFWDTALTSAVKCGYLEVVEALVSLSECDIDRRNRCKRSALDEAVYVWLLSVDARKYSLSCRYRIVRCLLASGAQCLSVRLLDMLVYCAATTSSGRGLLSKLVRLVCDRGRQQVRSGLLSVLLRHSHTHNYVRQLIDSGTVIDGRLLLPASSPLDLPLDNAILLVRASNQLDMLSRIERDTMACVSQCQRQYALLVRLLTLCGYNVHADVIRLLYERHGDSYTWLARYYTQPRRLSDMCRVAVRKQLKPNVPVAISTTKHIPHTLKQCLMMEQIA